MPCGSRFTALLLVICRTVFLCSVQHRETQRLLSLGGTLECTIWWKQDSVRGDGHFQTKCSTKSHRQVGSSWTARGLCRVQIAPWLRVERGILGVGTAYVQGCRFVGCPSTRSNMLGFLILPRSVLCHRAVCSFL